MAVLDNEIVNAIKGVIELSFETLIFAWEARFEVRSKPDKNLPAALHGTMSAGICAKDRNLVSVTRKVERNPRGELNAPRLVAVGTNPIGHLHVGSCC